MGKGFLRAAVPAALVMLTACGGGGGSRPQTPALPPPPPPPATSSAFPLTTTGSFNTISATRSYSRPGGVIAVDRFGVSGQSAAATISYNASTNSYTVVDGLASASFNASDLTTNGYIDTYSKQNGALTDELKLYNNVRSGASQASAPVQLNYLSFGAWSHTDSTTTDKYTLNYLLFGYPTSSTSMPRTGSATYSTAVTANTVNVIPAGGESQLGGSATFTANFGSGTINTDLNLVSSIGVTLPTFSGTGTISGNQFSGAFAPNDPAFVSGSFAGGFYGPTAGEMGYTFAIKRGYADPYAGASAGPALSWIVGAVVGKKN